MRRGFAITADSGGERKEHRGSRRSSQTMAEDKQSKAKQSHCRRRAGSGTTKHSSVFAEGQRIGAADERSADLSEPQINTDSHWKRERRERRRRRRRQKQSE